MGIFAAELGISGNSRRALGSILMLSYNPGCSIAGGIESALAQTWREEAKPGKSCF